MYQKILIGFPSPDTAWVDLFKYALPSVLSLWNFRVIYYSCCFIGQSCSGQLTASIRTVLTVLPCLNKCMHALTCKYVLHFFKMLCLMEKPNPY